MASFFVNSLKTHLVFPIIFLQLIQDIHALLCLVIRHGHIVVLSLRRAAVNGLLGAFGRNARFSHRLRSLCRSRTVRSEAVRYLRFLRKRDYSLTRPARHCHIGIFVDGWRGL